MSSGLWTWGGNDHGQLGDGTSVDHDSLVPIPALSGATAICTEYDWGCALMADGTVWTWGQNMFGQLGDGTENDRQNPAPISGLADIKSIATDSSTGYAVRSDGTVWTWGSNPIVPHLGVAPDIYNYRPRKVDGLSHVKAISVSSDVLFAMRTDGSVWAWGSERTWGPGNNGYWHFGLGELVGILREPTQVPGLTEITQLVQEEYTAYALKSDGSVWVWGQHGFGERRSWFAAAEEPETGYWPWHGAPAETSPAPTQSVPTRVADLPEIMQLATMCVYDREEQRHEGVSVFALHVDGRVSAWGRNNYGQLGDGTHEDRWNPVAVDGLERATALVVVYQSVYVLKDDGTVWAWGENRRGRLGDGTTKDRNRPVQVLGLSDVKSIHPHRGANGGLLAVRADGTIWTCGALSDLELAAEEQGYSGATRLPTISNVTQVLSDGPAYLQGQGIVPTRTAQLREPREGCFIATAVYGDYDARPVLVLRQFRDDSLAVSAIGRALIRFYYRVSSRLARHFEQGTFPARVARRLLDGVVARLERRVSTPTDHRDP